MKNLTNNEHNQKLINLSKYLRANKITARKNGENVEIKTKNRKLRVALPFWESKFQLFDVNVKSYEKPESYFDLNENQVLNKIIKMNGIN